MGVVPLSPQATIAWLAGNWEELVYSYADAPERTTQWFGTLMDCYNEEHRFYHIATHVEDCLDIAWRIASFEIGISTDYRKAEFAIWFHDAILDPRRSDNEELSCELAAKALYDMDFPDHYVETVCNYIMVTKRHDPRDPMEVIVSDSDLAILQTTFPEYLKYTENVRKEYSFLSDDEWRDGRVDWLNRMLAKEQIYFSEHFKRSKREDIARFNMKQELAYWQARSQGGQVINVQARRSTR